MLRLLLAGVLGAGTTLLVVSQGTFVYSAFQYQLPFRSALKVTPDPANIWSWHGTVPANQPVPIIVDIDGNGRSDTENPHVRVVLTDVQVVTNGATALTISDGTAVRWRQSKTDGPAEGSHAFATPLLLPVGSTLTLSSLTRIDEVHLIGRVLTL